MPGVRTGVTQRRLQELERQLRREVAQRKLNQSDDIDNPAGVVARDILPATDLDSGADNNWSDGTTSSPDHRWVQRLSTGGGGDTSYNEAYVIDNTSLAEDKVIGFLLVRALSTSVETTEIRFRSGTTGTGGVIDRWQVQGLQTEEDAQGIVANAVIFNKTEEGIIEFFQNVSNDENWVLEGAVGDKAGDEVDAPEEPILTGGGGGGRQGVQAETRADGGQRMLNIVEAGGGS